jgi:hypothetical protein
VSEPRFRRPVPRPHVAVATRPAAWFALAPAFVLVAALLALGLALVLSPRAAEAHADGSYPRTFNADWTNDPNAWRNRRYDMVAVSSRAAIAKLDSIKTLNPAGKLLITPALYAYYDAGPSIYPPTNGPWDATDPVVGWDRRYWDLLENNQFWCWGVDSLGTRVHASAYWGMWLGNFSSKCPPNAQGKRLCDVYADMVLDDLVASKGGTARVDGIFFDQLWDGPRWLNWAMGGCLPGDDCSQQTPGTERYAGFDLDANGVADPPESLHVWWSTGMNVVFARFRERMGDDFIILGNGNHHFRDTNGPFEERFPLIHGALDPAPNPWGFRWNDLMNGSHGYLTTWPTYFRAPVRPILDVELQGGDRWSFPVGSVHQSLFRFTLGSALLGDGYYTLNNGFYGCYYWQPEYDLRLGWPSGPATPVTLQGTTVWTRAFTNGVVWVNPTSTPVSAGTDNPAIAPYDGVIRETAGPINPGGGPAVAIALAQPRPNPSIDTPAILTFALAGGEDAKLSIVDARGRTIRHLWNGTGTGDAQVVFWDGLDDRGVNAPAGVYFARLTGEAGRAARQKLVRGR